MYTYGNLSGFGQADKGLDTWGRPIKAFQDVKNLINAWQDMVAQVPPSASNKVKNILTRQTSNNPPTANTIEGVIHYYNTNSDASQGYIDRDYEAMSQALADLKTLVAAPTGLPSSTGVPMDLEMTGVVPESNNNQMLLIAGAGLVALISVFVIYRSMTS